MNTWHFHQYLQFPEKLGVHDEVQLRGLIKEYPWFSTAHLLLAKCLKNQESYMFEKQLQHAALFAPDRSMMFRVLKGKNLPLAPSNLTDSEVLAPSDAGELPKATFEGEIPAPSIETSASISTSPQIIETNKEEEIKTETPEPLSSNFESEEELAEQFSPSYPTTQISDAPTSQIVFSTDELKLEAEPSDSDDLATESIQSSPQEEAAAENLYPEVKSFLQWIGRPLPKPADWLMSDNFPKNAELSWQKALLNLGFVTADFKEITTYALPAVGANIEEVQNENVTPSQVEEIPKINLEKGLAEPVDRMNLALKEVDTDHILEKFIQSNPTISRPKATFFKPSDAAQKSLEEHDDIYTETLAKVYIRQEKFNKAIQVYEKLMLKFPNEKEKFAALIHQLKHPSGK